MMKTLLIAASSLAMIAAPIAASARPYDQGDNGWRSHSSDNRGWQGRDYRDRGDRDYDHRGNGDAAVALGLFGLFLTAAIASSHHNYDEPRPYAARCDWETEAYRGPYGQVRYEQVQVCR
jgi:hypothetical protein